MNTASTPLSSGGNGGVQVVGAPATTGGSPSGDVLTAAPDIVDLSSPKSLLQDAASLAIFDAGVVKDAFQLSQGGRGGWSHYLNDLDALGAPAASLDLTSCYTIILLVDDSGSMAGAEGAVADAVNSFLADYRRAKDAGEIRSEVLVAVGGLNRGLIYPFTPIQQARSVSAADCRYGGGTALFDVTSTLCSLQMAKAAELQSFGIRSKSVTCLLTDGHDVDSRANAEQVATVISGLQGEKKNHIVSGIYLGQANQSTFTSMGIPPEWVLSGGQSAKDLMESFSRLSKMSRSSLTAAKSPKKGIEIS